MSYQAPKPGPSLRLSWNSQFVRRGHAFLGDWEGKMISKLAHQAQQEVAVETNCAPPGKRQFSSSGKAEQAKRLQVTAQQ